MNTFSQIFAVTAMNLRAMKSRAVASGIIVLGVAVLVAIVLSIQSIGTGYLQSFADYTSSDHVIIYNSQAMSEQQSNISREAALKIADLPGIKKDLQGKPLASMEVSNCMAFTRRADSLDGFTCIRGVSGDLAKLRPKLKLVEGRFFTSGLREMVIGRQAQRRFMGMDLGGKVIFPDGPWTIVGIVEGGGFGEGQLFGDSETLIAAYRRNTFSSVLAVLGGANALQTVKAALAADPTLNVAAEDQLAFLERTQGQPVMFYKIITAVLGSIIGLGVLFAALNMMYAAVNSRTREIATLRAIGFSPGPVVASVFAEAVLLTLLGAMLGIGAARFAFHGNVFTVGNAIIRLSVSPTLMLVGLGIALFIGLMGALFPAIRAATLPVTTALQIR